MKIICAPDSFKESMTAEQAAAAMRDGVLRVLPDAAVDLCPIADGGEGTVDAMLAATGGTAQTTSVTGPLGEAVESRWGMLGEQPGQPRTAVIEMAAAAGLALVPSDKRDPTQTTTFGVGELICAALDEGAKKILVGIGGSATTDGGAGMAQALGVQFNDEKDQPITQPMAGGLLSAVKRIDMSQLDARLKDVQIVVACDVTNPLTGDNGAAAVYGPQKGATPEQVTQLDQNLAHLAALIGEQLGKDVLAVPGSGAAGGLGAGLLAFVDAQLARGIDLVLEAVNFTKRAADCDYCFTGEGRIDGQSLSGKACLGVAQQAKTGGAKTIAFVGSAADDADRTLEAGLHTYHVIAPDLPAAESMARGPQLLADCVERVCRSMF